MQDFWNSWHAASARGWRDFLFTGQIRFPEGTSLSYHSFAWPQVFAVALLSRIFGADFTTLVAAAQSDPVGQLSAGRDRHVFSGAPSAGRR